MRNVKMITGAAVIALCLGAAGGSAFAKTNGEIEAEVLEFMDSFTSAAGDDYAAFRAFYDEDFPEEGIESDFASDWTPYTEGGQHFVTVVAAAPPYYYVDITSANCEGTYPEFSSQQNDWGMLCEDTGSGLLLSSSEEGYDLVNENPEAIYPSGLLEAGSGDRNRALFDNTIYWYMDETHVVEGALLDSLRFAWQDEEGNLYLSFILANGTGESREFTKFYVTLKDSAQGTVFEGDLTGSAVEGSFALENGKNALVTCKVDAADVQTGTQKWGTLSCDIQSEHK